MFAAVKIVAPVLLCAAVVACTDGSGGGNSIDDPLSRTSEAYRSAVPAQPTSALRSTTTPVALDRSALQPPRPCPGCLVYTDGTGAHALDVASGESVNLSTLPQEPIPTYDWQPSPDGASWVIPCDSNGNLHPAFTNSFLCLWKAAASPLPVDGEQGTFYNFARVVWSPDSRHFIVLRTAPRIAEFRPLGEQLTLSVHNIATGVNTRIADSSPHELWGVPSWSPGGDRFAISRVRNGVVGHLLVVDAATGGVTQLPEKDDAPALALSTPIWSADGSRVVFRRTNLFPATPSPDVTRSFRSSIVIASVDGSVMRELDIEDGIPVAWSANDRWIIVEQPHPNDASYTGRVRLTAVRSDGTGERLLSEQAEPSTATVSPEGSRLAFIAADHDADPAVFVAAFDEGEPIRRQLAEPAFRQRPPLWTKDGTGIVVSVVGFCGQGGCSPGAVFLLSADGSASPKELLPGATRILGWLP